MSARAPPRRWGALTWPTIDTPRSLTNQGKFLVIEVIVRTTSEVKMVDEDEERDAVFYRLDGLGYRVGLGLVERYGVSLSPEPPSHLLSSIAIALPTIATIPSLPSTLNSIKTI